MSYGIDKVIDEIKSRCGSKFNVDGIQNMISGMKHPAEDSVAVVEIEAEPIAEEHKGEAEAPELSGGEESENCPKCGKSPCECPEDKPAVEEEKTEDEKNEDATEGMEAITDTNETTEDITPAEQDKMDEILKAIKTFFPNENTEDVLVRIVSKLIDR